MEALRHQIDRLDEVVHAANGLQDEPVGGKRLPGPYLPQLHHGLLSQLLRVAEILGADEGRVQELRLAQTGHSRLRDLHAFDRQPLLFRKQFSPLDLGQLGGYGHWVLLEENLLHDPVSVDKEDPEPLGDQYHSVTSIGSRPSTLPWRGCVRPPLPAGPRAHPPSRPLAAGWRCIQGSPCG